MIYVVLNQGELVIASSILQTAVDAFNRQPVNSSIVSLDSIDDLDSLLASKRQYATKQTELDESPVVSLEEAISDAYEDLIDALDQMGINEQLPEKLSEEVRNNGKKAVAKVRHLGIKGMKTVGEGFVTLGDTILKAAKFD